MKTQRRIRILIADDHLVARLGVSAMIEEQPDMVIVGEATDGEEAVALYNTCRPDVMVLDLRMPILSGIGAATAIRRKHPDARIVVFTTYGGDEDIRSALAAGVKAYLTKDVLHDELLGAIRAAYAGETYSGTTLSAFCNRLERSDLSAREVEVLELIAQGLGNKQIAHTLRIAEDTVKNHVKHIFAKLGVQDRTRAATIAIERGIIHLS